MKIKLDVRLIGILSSTDGIIHDIYHKAAQLHIGKWKLFRCVRTYNFCGDSLFGSRVQLAIYQNI